MAEASVADDHPDVVQTPQRRSPELTMESLTELISRLLDEKLATRTPNPYATTEGDFRMNTPAPRRSSSLFAPGMNIPSTPLASTENQKEITIVYKEPEIKEEDKMQNLTPHALMTFKRKVDAINARSVVKITLQHYISERVMKEIWNKECYKKTEFTWAGSHEMLYLLDHEKFMTIVARHLRPTSYHEYCQMLRTCLRKPRGPAGYTIMSLNYDQVLFQQMADYFQTIKEVDELFRYAATEEDLKFLPKLEYGKEQEADGLGVFGIAIAMLDVFANDFKRLVGSS